MATTITRMLPFRQYNEQDVINLYSLNTATGEAGSLVYVSAANLNLDPTAYVTRDDAQGFTHYLGNASSLYPEVPYKVAKTTTTGQKPLGILLKDVRTVDENGENLMFYPRKKEELQCVSSGEVVPIATKGLFMVNARALVGNGPPPLNSYAVPALNGMFTGYSSPTDEQKSEVCGKFIATGSRESVADTDEFAGVYAILKLEL